MLTMGTVSEPPEFQTKIPILIQQPYFTANAVKNRIERRYTFLTLLAYVGSNYFEVICHGCYALDSSKLTVSELWF